MTTVKGAILLAQLRLGYNYSTNLWKALCKMRTMIIANTCGALMLLFVFLLGGEISDWWVWAYWVSPLTYAFNAMSMKEMFAPRWMHPQVTYFGSLAMRCSSSTNHKPQDHGLLSSI